MLGFLTSISNILVFSVQIKEPALQNLSRWQQLAMTMRQCPRHEGEDLAIGVGSACPRRGIAGGAPCLLSALRRPQVGIEDGFGFTGLALQTPAQSYATVIAQTIARAGEERRRESIQDLYTPRVSPALT